MNILVCLLAFLSGGLNLQESTLLEQLYNKLEFGPHKVGYRVLYERDFSRQFYSDGEEGYPDTITDRPVQISVWYPAEESGDSQLTTTAIMAADLSEIASEPATAEEAEAYIAQYDEYFGSDKSMQIPTKATLDANPARGSFPTILYNPGQNGSPSENTLLFELLASHGYIIIGTPSNGHLTSYATESRVGVEDMARDMEFALNAAARKFPVDHTKLATMGRSWGGQPAALLACRNQNVKALVTLDATANYQNGFDELTFSQSFDLAKLRGAVLMTYAQPFPAFVRSKALAAESPFATGYVANFDTMEHYDFCSFGTIARAASLEDVEAKESMLGNYVTAITMIFEVLESQLKTDSSDSTVDLTSLSDSKAEISTELFEAAKPPMDYLEVLDHVQRADIQPLVNEFKRVRELDAHWQMVERGMFRRLYLTYLTEAALEAKLQFSEICVATYPERFVMVCELAMLHAQDGNGERCAELQEQAKATENPFVVSRIISLTQGLLNAGDTDGAIIMLDSGLDVFSGDVSFATSVLSMLKKSDNAEIFETYKEIIAKQFPDVPALAEHLK